MLTINPTPNKPQNKPVQFGKIYEAVVKKNTKEVGELIQKEFNGTPKILINTDINKLGEYTKQLIKFMSKNESTESLSAKRSLPFKITVMEDKEGKTRIIANAGRSLQNMENWLKKRGETMSHSKPQEAWKQLNLFMHSNSNTTKASIIKVNLDELIPSKNNSNQTFMGKTKETISKIAHLFV